MLATKIAEDTPFFDLFLRFNRRLLRLLGTAHLELSVNESHVLAEVADNKVVLAKEISAKLAIEKSTLSRTISNLAARGLIKATNDKQDRRAKALDLTAAGKEALRADFLVRSQVIERCVAPLSTQQQEALAHYLGVMADGLRSAQLNEIEQEHPVERQVRRLTRALGVLNSDFCATGWAIEKCQLMMALYCVRKETALFELKRAMPYELSALSRLISMLEGERLIQKRVSKSDRRAFMLGLTALGQKEIASIAEEAESYLLRSIVGLSAQELLNFRRILELFLDDSADRVSPALLLISAPQSEQERSAARAFLVEQLVRLGLHYELGASLLDDKDICFLIRVDRHVHGVAEISFKQSILQLSHFVVEPGPNRNAQAHLLIKSLANEALLHFGQMRARVGPCCDRTLLEELFGTSLSSPNSQIDL